MKQALFLVLFFSNSLFAQVNLNQGLVAYYPFSGNANDQSGNNNNPVFNNATLTIDRFGNPNTAYSFNGIDNYIRIPNNPSLNSSSQISICAWVKVSGFYQGPCHGNNIVMKGDADYLTGNYMIRFDDSYFTNNQNCSIISPDINHESFFGLQSTPLSNTPFIQTSQWYSVVYTCDGTTAKTYVNCLLVGSGPANGISFSNSYDLFLGRLNDPQYPYWFNGVMDEVRIYNRALNQDEVNVYGDCTASSCNNWLNTPSQPSYIDVGDLDVPGNKITVEALLNSTLNNNGFGDIVSKHSTYTDVNYLLRPYSAEITTTNGYYKALTDCPLSPNKTYHVALVYDGTSLKFYRNGFLLVQVPASGNLVLNDWHTWIGFFQPQSLNENFTGYINEVRIWNVARTQQEIRAYMNASLPNPTTQTGLLAYYIFNDLQNKQGNATWNGMLGGSASINRTNPQCDLIVDSCSDVSSTIANFLAPDTVCVNTPVQLTNTSVNATNYYWNFCVANINTSPTGINMGNVGGQLKMPVYVDYAYDNGNYYGFITNNFPAGLLRLDFGNSLLNIPTATNLGSVGGTIPENTEGLQIVKNEGKWYVIIVGGDPAGSGTPSNITKIELGASITNNSPIGTDWGNLGNLAYPHDLYVFDDNGHWYGFTVNYGNNTVTRFDFTTSFSNTPTATNLGNIGNLDGPTGLHAIKDNNDWYLFITNATSSTLSRLDFGASLLSTPTGQNIGNINGVFHTCWDIYIMKFCGETVAFVINANQSYNDLIRLSFGNSVINTPAVQGLGNIGNCLFPHCLSKIFRAGPDLYSFITNVDNNTLSRLNFTGCTNSSIPNSTAQNPPTVVYNMPGIYNINLSVDDGLPTQTVYCKQIVVTSIDSVRIQDTTIGCTSFDFKGFGYSNPISTWQWDFGDGTTAFAQNTNHSYSSKGKYAVKLIVSDVNGCKDSSSALVTTIDPPLVKTNNDTAFCPGIQVQLNTIGALNYSWSPPAGLNDPNIANPIATPNSSTQYIVVGTGANGCTAKDTVNITVYLKPTITKSHDSSLCKNSSAQLFASGGINYSWSPSNTLNNSFVPDPVASPAFNTTYIVTVTDGNTCQNSDSIRISIHPDPVFNVSNSANVCINGSVQLNASGGNVYSWQPTGSLNNSTIAAPIANPQTTTNYSVSITDSICNNTTTLSTTVTVIPLPIVVANKSNDLDCSSDFSQLNATGALQYSWSPANTLNNPNIANPVAKPTTETLYIVAGTDAYGCTNYDSVIVNITGSNKSGYLMPSAFTPNNDGLNDCYGIKYWGIIEELDFGIYNRWGERIFYTTKPGDCWDGTYRGIKQNPDVYVYLVTAKTICGKVFKKGTFVLIR